MISEMNLVGSSSALVSSSGRSKTIDTSISPMSLSAEVHYKHRSCPIFEGTNCRVGQTGRAAGYSVDVISCGLIGVGRFLCDFCFVTSGSSDTSRFHEPLIPDCPVLPLGSSIVQLNKISLHVVGLEKIVEFDQGCGAVEASLFDSTEM